MSDFDSAISIPPNYFRKNVAHAYRSVPFALIRELFQNSLDAGASKIVFDFGPLGYRFTDNGHGMTEEVLRDGFLSLGGSIKKDGDVGGFGEAKVLLCFAGESFSIHTLDNKVAGAGANFSLKKCPEEFIDGTTVKASFTEEMVRELDLYPEGVAEALALFMRAADFKALVMSQGKPIRPKGKRQNLVRTLPFAEVFTGPKFSNIFNVVVRHNGVPMFFTQVSDFKGAIYCDLTKHGRDVLTSNRDYFKSGYGGQFQSLLTEMARDTESFSRRKPSYTRFKGRENTPVQSRTIEGCSSATSFDGDTVHRILKENGNALFREMDLTPVAKALLETSSTSYAPETVTETIVMLQDVLTEDFIIGSVGGGEIPKRFHPKSFSAAVRKLAKEWKVAVKTVVTANKLSFPYLIGFTLMDDRMAEFHWEPRKLPSVLVNPRKVLGYNETTKDRIFRLLQLAAHELAHRKHPYHGEEFTLYAEQLLLTTLQRWDGLAKFRKAVREAELFKS